MYINSASPNVTTEIVFIYIKTRKKEKNVEYIGSLKTPLPINVFNGSTNKDFVECFSLGAACGLVVRALHL